MHLQIDRIARESLWPID